MLAYEIAWGGITGYYTAETRGRARWKAALSIEDAWPRKRGPREILIELRCKRAPWMDLEAIKLGREGWIPA